MEALLRLYVLRVFQHHRGIPLRPKGISVEIKKVGIFELLNLRSSNQRGSCWLSSRLERRCDHTHHAIPAVSRLVTQWRYRGPLAGDSAVPQGPPLLIP